MLELLVEAMLLLSYLSRCLAPSVKCFPLLFVPAHHAVRFKYQGHLECILTKPVCVKQVVPRFQLHWNGYRMWRKIASQEKMRYSPSERKVYVGVEGFDIQCNARV